jgi:large subunit ribosomal protein L7Ae
MINMAGAAKLQYPKDIVEKAYEAVTVAKGSGKIRKGVNETTKAIDRGIAKLVVMAEDVTPPEILMHLPVLCEEKKVPFVFVPSKVELGKACGIDVPTSSIAIAQEGDAKRLIHEIAEKVKTLK